MIDLALLRALRKDAEQFEGRRREVALALVDHVDACEECRQSEEGPACAAGREAFGRCLAWCLPDPDEERWRELV